MKTDFTRASQLMAHQFAMVLAGFGIEIVLVAVTAATTLWLGRAIEAGNRLPLAAAITALLAEGIIWMLLRRARALQAKRNAALFDPLEDC